MGFWVLWGLFRGLIKGLTGSLYCFSDSNGTVILLRVIVVIYCSFLNRFDKPFESYSIIRGKGLRVFS